MCKHYTAYSILNQSSSSFHKSYGHLSLEEISIFHSPIDPLDFILDDLVFLWCQHSFEKGVGRNRPFQPHIEEIGKVGIRHSIIIWRIGEPNLRCPIR